MNLKVKELGISTGGLLVVLMREQDATQLGLIQGDRITISRKFSAVVDITASIDLISLGEIGVFSELVKLGLHNGAHIDVEPAKKPISISYIKQKMKKERLSEQQYYEIVKDIVNGDLTDVEIAYFVSACYINELNDNEIIYLTNAILNTGNKLVFEDKIIADKHCIGGVAGNRTTAFVVPIIAAAGVKIPKTSSRSITSPAGTADTMEVLCNVSLSMHEIKDIVNKIGACLAWGGAIDIAPADDKIIRVEHPMALDPIGQMVASILSKKKAVGATHCLIDIPLGPGSKVETPERAILLKNIFEKISNKIGLKTKAIITDGSEPIGNGIGPALEARDLLWTLSKDPRGSKQLLDKGIFLAGELLELVGRSKKGEGKKLAQELIVSGKAYAKFQEIITAQGGKNIHGDQIVLGKHPQNIYAGKSGILTHLDNKTISKIAQIAGAPSDKKAGLYLYKHKKDKVKQGDVLFTIYSSNEVALKDAVDFVSTNSGYYIK